MNNRSEGASERKRDRIRFKTVKALVRKGSEERRSSFRAGQFDLLGFLLRLVLIAAIAALFIIFFGQFVEIYIGVKVAGEDFHDRARELFTMLYTAVIFGMVIGCVGSIGRELFAADDMKIFSALPINEKTLFVAKLVNIYFSQLMIAFVAVFTVNTTFALNSGLNTSSSYWMSTVLICFILPLITIAIASVLVLPYQALKRILRERFVITFILLTALLGVAFWLYSLILGGVKQMLLGDSVRYFFSERVMNIIGRVCAFLYPAVWFATIMSGNSAANRVTVLDDPMWNWLWLALLAAVCLLASLLIIKNILGKALRSRNEGTAYALRSSHLRQRHSAFTALLKKEFLLIFRTPSYMFSYFSVALIMPLMVYFCMDVGASLVDNLVGLNCNLELALFLTILFGALTNIFCATNISRDGEMFYTVKALPVGYKTVFFSKIVLCLFVTALSQFLSAVLLLATGLIGWGDAAFVAFIGVLFSFVNIAVATRYDFNHAKFSTEDDGEIKEASGTVSAIIVMGILLSFAVGGLVFVLKVLSVLRKFEYGALTYLLTAGLALLAVGLALFYMLFRLEEKYYEFSGGGI